jgi:hypothetical protein
MSRYLMVCRDCADQLLKAYQVTTKDWLDSDLGNLSDKCQFCSQETHLKEVEMIPFGSVVIEEEREA